jgi:GNAT superfamily N-acetyltransferase
MWVSHRENEIELAHLVVSPDRRNEGVGRRLVAELMTEGARFQSRIAWVRVVPENTAALRCYRAAGFRFAPAEQESELNSLQPRNYRWLSRIQPAVPGRAAIHSETRSRRALRIWRQIMGNQK